MNILNDEKFSLLEGFSNSVEANYGKYVKEHIRNVQKGYDYIVENIPEVLDKLEIPKNEMDRQINLHDRSKWSSAEFDAYAEHFYGKNKGKAEDPDFDEAWKYHYQRNPHHPEFWGNKKDMPFSCILEMICDWWAFSWKDGNLYEIFDFWNSENGQEKKALMTRKTTATVEWLLDEIQDSLKKYSNITESRLDEICSMPLNEDFNFIDNNLKKDFKALDKIISGSEKICIVRHIHPDADAFGSVKALAEGIKAKYPKKEVIIGEEETSIYLTNKDLLIILDLGTKDRIACNISGDPKTARVDHHITGMKCDVTIENEDAGSTCELIALFLDYMNYQIDMKSAEMLFKGILADTGRLQYSLSDTTLQAISLLRNKGVDYKKIYSQMYVKDEKSLAAKAFIINNYKKTPNGVAYLYIDKARLEASGLKMDKIGKQVHELGDIKGSPIWCFILNKGNAITASVRSRGIDLRDVMSHYDGGGHANACGAALQSIDSAKQMLIELDKLLGITKEFKPELV